MPAAAYYIHAERSFPDRANFQASEPLSLLPNDQENVEECSSRVRRSAEQEIEGYEIYVAEHDYRERLRFLGRARGQTFREYVSVRTFPLFRFLTDPDGLSFHPLIIKTNRKVASDFVDRMNQYVADFRLDRTVVDFDCLRPRLEEIRGAWFSRMQGPNISSTAVFGPHVELSHEFQHAEAIGHLANIIIPFEIDGEWHPIQITANGAVVLYESFALEAHALRLVKSVLSELLSDCIDPLES